MSIKLNFGPQFEQLNNILESFNWWWQNRSDRFTVDRGVMPLGYTLFWSFHWALVLMVYCSPFPMKKRKEKKKFELNAQSFTCILFRFNKVFYRFEFIKKKKKQYIGVFQVKMKNSKKNYNKTTTGWAVAWFLRLRTLSNTTQFSTFYYFLL